MTIATKALPLSESRAVRVTAHFAGRSHVALDSDWPLILDGLLAGVVEQRHPSARPTTHSLPLARYAEDLGKQWSWAASVGTPMGTTSMPWAYRWKGSPQTITVDCTGVQWHCIGDPDRVRDLLRDLPHLGNRRKSSPVASWDILDAGGPPGQLGEAMWLPSGRIARPIAARGAGALGVPNAETVEGAVRPPYWRPPPTNANDTFGRAWKPVIAPWTERPANPANGEP